MSDAARSRTSERAAALPRWLGLAFTAAAFGTLGTLILPRIQGDRPSGPLPVSATPSIQLPAGTVELRGRHTSAEGRVELRPGALDLGNVRIGGRLGGQAQVVNGTAGAVRIHAFARCGCIEHRLDPPDGWIAAGATGSISFDLATRGRPGPMVETIRVTTSETSAPELQLVVSANVLGGVAARHVWEQVEAVLPGQPKRLRIEFAASDDVPAFDVLSVSLSRVTEEGLEPVAALPFMRAPGATPPPPLELELPGVADSGRHKIRLDLSTTLRSEVALAPLVFSYEVQLPIRPALRAIHLGKLQPGRVARARLRLVAANSRVAYSILAASVHEAAGSSTARAFRTHVAWDEVGWYVDLEYLPPAAGAGTRLATMLRVEHDRSDVLPIEVPIHGIW